MATKPKCACWETGGEHRAQREAMVDFIGRGVLEAVASSVDRLGFCNASLDYIVAAILAGQAFWLVCEDVEVNAAESDAHTKIDMQKVVARIDLIAALARERALGQRMNDLDAMETRGEA